MVTTALEHIARPSTLLGLSEQKDLSVRNNEKKMKQK
jgi:hypothetical protein